MAVEKIYLVEQDGKKRLVKGKSQLAVRNGVAKESIDVRVATQEELVGLVQSGTVVETLDAGE